MVLTDEVVTDMGSPTGSFMTAVQGRACIYRREAAMEGSESDLMMTSGGWGKG